MPKKYLFLGFAVLMSACSQEDFSKFKEGASESRELENLSLTGPMDYLIYNRFEPLFDPEEAEYQAEYLDASVH